jgi:hypothetical protein
VQVVLEHRQSRNDERLAGVVRADTNFLDVVRMVAGIAMVPTDDSEQKTRLLEFALDGLRYQPS